MDLLSPSGVLDQCFYVLSSFCLYCEQGRGHTGGVIHSLANDFTSFYFTGDSNMPMNKTM